MRQAGVSLGVVAALAVAAPAHAATTIGTEPRGDERATIWCGSRCTIFPSATDRRGVVAPFDGVVVRWRLAYRGNFAANGPQVLHLRTFRYEQGSIMPRAAGGATTAAAAGVVRADARVPIAAGDHVGVESHGISVGATVTSGRILGAFVGDGEQGVVRLHDLEPALAADIEPDVDRDGFGDETQDGCPTLFDALGRACPIGGAFDVDITEGETAVLEVRLTGPRLLPTTVAFRTEPGAAVAPQDFTATRGEATILPGQTSARVQVPTVEDGEIEQTEPFTVRFSAGDEQIEDPIAEVRIADDDPPPIALPTPGVIVEGASTAPSSVRVACTSRRRFAVRPVGSLTGARIVAARLVGVIDRVVPVRGGRAHVDLTGLPRRMYLLRLTGRRGGRAITQLRRYRTCKPGRR